MAVSLIERGVGARAVQVSPPFRIVNPDARGARRFHDDVEGVVVVRSPAVLYGDQGVRRGRSIEIGHSNHLSPAGQSNRSSLQHRSQHGAYEAVIVFGSHRVGRRSK